MPDTALYILLIDVHGCFHCGASEKCLKTQLKIVAKSVLKDFFECIQIYFDIELYRFYSLLWASLLPMHFLNVYYNSKVDQCPDSCRQTFGGDGWETARWFMLEWKGVGESWQGYIHIKRLSEPCQRPGHSLNLWSWEGKWSLGAFVRAAVYLDLANGLRRALI